MREILFRGKDAETGKWIYGWVFGNEAKSIMIELDTEYVSKEGVEAYRTSVVIPETVGQYTGLDDKNGVKIFEGDVVTAQHDFVETRSSGYIENGTLEVWDEYQEGIDETGEVKFAHAAFMIKEWDLGIFTFDELEIIGNIYDNQELLNDSL